MSAKASGWAQAGRVREPRWVVLVLAAISYLALSGAVAAGATVPLDRAAYELFRPGGEWGRAQHLLGNVVDVLQPVSVALVATLVAVWATLRRRTLRPLLLLGLGTVLTCALVGSTKLVVPRAGPGEEVGQLLGSYPSGHAAVLVVGCAVIAWSAVASRRAPRAAWAFTASLSTLMSWSILVIGMHWLSDVIGGLLLGLAVVTSVGAVAVRLP